MRSGLHGTFATLLLLIPVLSIPALAIFGIPQFAPVVQSPTNEGPDPDREHRVGQSARPAGDGLLSDLEDAPNFGGEPASNPRDRQGESVPIPRRTAETWDSPNREALPAEFNEPPKIRPLWADESGGGNARKNKASATTASAESLDRSDKRNHFDNGQGVDNRPVFENGQRPRNGARPFPDVGQSTASSPPPRNPNRGGVQFAVGDGSADPRIVPQSYQRERRLPADPYKPSAVQESDQAPLTWQSAVRRLNELEIRNFRLERGHHENQFIFICSYTPSDSPRVSNRFEAEADEPLKAVEKVLEQIEDWRKRQEGQGGSPNEK
jgi:hypothetical protein